MVGVYFAKEGVIPVDIMTSANSLETAAAFWDHLWGDYGTTKPRRVPSIRIHEAARLPPSPCSKEPSRKSHHEQFDIGSCFVPLDKYIVGLIQVLVSCSWRSSKIFRRNPRTNFWHERILRRESFWSELFSRYAYKRLVGKVSGVSAKSTAHILEQSSRENQIQALGKLGRPTR